MFDSKIMNFINKLNDNEYTIHIFDLNEITKIIYGVGIDLTLVEKNTEVNYYIDGNLTREESMYVDTAILNESAEKDIYKYVLNDMCKKKKIPIGKYRIQAFW